MQMSLMDHRQGLRRFLVFADQSDRRYLCVCAARDKRHALKIARQTGFRLSRTAFAILEG